MRRISREERIGALVLAAVTMVAIIGGAWWRHMSDTDVPSPAEVTIISKPDSISTVEQKYHGNDKGKRSGKVKDNHYKRNHRNKKHIGDGQVQVAGNVAMLRRQVITAIFSVIQCRRDDDHKNYCGNHVV